MNDSIVADSSKRKPEFIIELPIWVPGFKGRFSVGDITIEGEGQNDNLINQFFNSRTGIDFYFVGKVGVKLDRWLVEGDVYGGQLKEAIEFTYKQVPLTDVQFFSFMPRIYLGYNFYETDFKSKKTRQSKKLKLWTYGGFRYYYINIYAELNRISPKLDITKKWLDPIIGLTIPVNFNRFTLVFQNDIGGFGLGSDITYNCQFYGAYKLGRIVSLELGWVYENINYSEEKRKEYFTYKVVMQGPMLGVVFRF